MRWVYDDGGRAAASYKGTTGDCVCRAIAIATEQSYQAVYDLINETALKERITRRRRKRGRSTARDGVYSATVHRIILGLGWVYQPTMQIGSGCKVHLRDGELPDGRLIVQVSRHIVAVIDGVVHDIYDPSRGGTRCVYGYYTRKSLEVSAP